MAAISGHNASVEFGDGYTTDAFAWAIETTSESVETTPFVAPKNSVTRTTGITQWSGTYRCRLQTTVWTNLATENVYYSANVHAFSFSLISTAIPTTPFAADTHTHAAGLMSASGDYTCYLDSSVPLPVSGDTDQLGMRIGAGITVIIPIVVIATSVGVSTDGSDRHVTVSWESNGDFSDDRPVVGIIGDATFKATKETPDIPTVPEYAGQILITKLAVSMRAARDAAEYTYTFVGSGDLTAS